MEITMKFQYLLLDILRSFNNIPQKVAHIFTKSRTAIHLYCSMQALFQ